MEILKSTVYCLKINYSGVVKDIKCESTFNYMDVLQQIVNAFNLPSDYTDAIILSTRYGNVIKREFFERVVMKNPSDGNMYYVTLDLMKLKPEKSNVESNNRVVSPHMELKNKNKRKLDIDEDETNGAVPVYRQNCFIVSLDEYTNKINGDQPNNHVQFKKRLCVEKNFKIFKNSLKRISLNQNNRKRAIRV